TSVAATLISRQQQVSWNSLAAHVTPSNPNFQHWSLPFFQFPLNVQAQLIAVQVKTQAFLIANLDVFYISLIGSLSILWIPFFLEKPKIDEVNEQIMH
ncbi:MAG: hypothetical protein ACK4M7_01090, partial [Burkholderiales bacterium]